MARDMVLGGGGKGIRMEYYEDKWICRCFLNASAKGHTFFERPKDKCLQHYDGTQIMSHRAK